MPSPARRRRHIRDPEDREGKRNEVSFVDGERLLELGRIGCD